MTTVALVMLVAAVGALLLLTVLGLDSLSGARAYIAGENQWSKAERSAVAHLLRYSHTRDEGDYAVFLEELRVPLGDRRAREELLRPDPDLDIVRAGLLEGRNHPDDIGRMITFFRRFHAVPRLARALDVWRRADQDIEVLIEVGARLYAAIVAGGPGEVELARMRTEIEATAGRLHAHEVAFSDAMGSAARWAHHLLLLIVGGFGLVPLALSVVLLRRASHRTTASEQSARASEERKRAVLDTIEDGYWDADLDGRITFVNAGMCRILGRPAHEILGHDLRAFLDPDSAASAVSALAHVQRTGRSVRALALVMPAPNGQRRIVEVSMRLVRGADDAARGFSAIARDVTARRLHDEALQRSEGEYRALVEHAPYGIYRSTPEGRLLAVNSALVSMLGYATAADLLGADMSRQIYVDPEDRDRLIAEHGDRKSISDVDVEWRRRDGSPLDVRLNGRRIRDASFDGYEMFVEDLSQRNALEVQLRHAQKMQAVGQLTGGIAHDFNNLLTIVAATADVLAEDHPDGSARSDIGELRAAADRGAEMVRKLLAFSRRGQLRLEAMEVGPVVADTVAMLRRILPAHIDIVNEPGGTILAHADRGAVEQVLLNLATNARDAMPDGGVLRVAASTTYLDDAYCSAFGWGKPGRFSTLTVTDSGCGMDEATRDRAFEPFFTTKAPGAGTGLGMAMVYGIVRQHEGFIDLESEPGLGTVVRIHLPVARSAPVARTDTVAANRPGGSETILVVEDEPAILAMSRRILERRGYRVLTAPDGEEALSLLRDHGAEIDLVLSDVVMPRLGGAALYRATRAESMTVPFLFTSGYTAREVGGMLDPALPVVPKPWSIDVLEQRVREALDGTPVPSTA